MNVNASAAAVTYKTNKIQPDKKACKEQARNVKNNQ
jgi:hypothetical protein